MSLSRLMNEATGAITVPLDHVASGGPSAAEWTAFAGMLFFPATLLLIEMVRKLANLSVPAYARVAAVAVTCLGSFSVYVMFRPSEASMKLFGLVIATGMVGWLLSPKWKLVKEDAKQERRLNPAIWALACGAVVYCSFIAGSGVEYRIDNLKAGLEDAVKGVEREIDDLQASFASVFVRG